MQGMVFLCLVLKQILHHFIEMVLTSKLFFFTLLKCPFCFVLRQTICENLSVSLRRRVLPATCFLNAMKYVSVLNLSLN